MDVSLKGIKAVDSLIIKLKFVIYPESVKSTDMRTIIHYQLINSRLPHSTRLVLDPSLRVIATTQCLQLTAHY